MTGSIAGRIPSLGSEGLLEGPGTSEWRVSGREPIAVALPDREEQVADVLRVASDEGWGVIPAGAGGAMSWGHAPDRDSLVLSLARLDGITEYEPADLTLTAEAGITLPALGEATAEQGQWLPLDPPASEHSTLGGLLATASAGPLRAGYGTARDHVLGLTLISGDGRRFPLGGKVVKNVAGFDLTRLAVGSWGALGVITSATVRLHPLPAVDTTLLFNGMSLAEQVPTARSLAGAPVPLAALELLGPGPGAGLDWGIGGEVAVRLNGNEEAVEASIRILRTRAGREEAARLDGPETRRFFQEVARLENRADLIVRMALLPGLLGELALLAEGLIAELEALAPAGPPSAEVDPTMRNRVAVHVTEGILRLALAAPGLARGRDARTVDPAVEILHRTRERLEARGGSLQIVRAPDALLSELAPFGALGDAAGIMSGLRTLFDPQGVLSPGRFGF